jgi:diguanylate cyclase (GGDEF)-like protein/PAS domain S-box-containing protein
MSHLSSSSEPARLRALAAIDLLDTPAEARFDRYTRLACMTFGVPIALISLVDGQRQWFKSRCGLDTEQTPRSVAFCSHTIALGEMLVVEDAGSDARFADNPLVAGAPHIRFYAGQPVFSDGQAVGTLCIADCQPRAFSTEQRACLRDLADMVEVELNHNRVVAARVIAEQSLKALNAELEQRVALRTAELEVRLDELSREVARRTAVEVSLRETEAWNRTIVASSYSGFVGVDSEGRIIEWNASAERIFGWRHEQALGQNLSELIVPMHLRQAHENGMRRLLDSGTATVIDKKTEVPALTASGRQITIEMTISPYEWEGNRCFGAFLNDVSERILTQQQLEEKQELLDAVLESIDVGVVACDAVGNLTLFNRAARALHGLDRTRMSPAEWPDHYSLYHADGRTALVMDEVPLVRVLRGEIVHDQSIVIAPKDRMRHTLLASGRPLRSATGRLLGAVVVMKDITELNASRLQLTASERQLRTITENLPAFIGKANAAGDFVFLNGRAAQFYGKMPDQLVGHKVRGAYSPDDYARIEPYIRRVMAGERVTFEDVTIVDGTPLHYQCCLVPQHAANGQPEGFFCMAFDISARKLGELRQAESEERLRTITDNVPVLIAYLGKDRRYAFANAVHQSWLGIRPDQILGQTVEGAVGEACHRQLAGALQQAWRGQASQCEHEIVRKKHTRIAHSTFLPQLRDGVVCGVYILTTDATASRLHERSLHALAHTDALTRLPNRRQFELGLAGATSRSLQDDQRCALLYIDVDRFKQINDRYGHGTGDAVLVEFAQRLRAVVRGSDLVARLAGDEFTVLLSDVQSSADVETVANKILAAIRQPFKVGARMLSVTTTIGAGLVALPANPRTLMEVADLALYQAKSAGRDTFAMRSSGQGGGLDEQGRPDVLTAVTHCVLEA